MIVEKEEKKEERKEIKTKFSIQLNEDELNILNHMLEDYRELGLSISKASLIRKLLWETKAMNEYKEVIYGF